MSLISNFHEVRFPEDIALSSRGGPERKTEIITLVSGHEVRNSRWADSRRRYNAGYGIKSLNDLHSVIAFFEERRGKLYGFRWLDRSDFKSTNPKEKISPLNQPIATGDGVTNRFQLTKTYGSNYAPYVRTITKPVAGTVKIAINSEEVTGKQDITIDPTTGTIDFAAAPANGASITAGFLFDVPVRFDSDFLEINLTAFIAGEIPNIPLIELKQ